MQSSDSGSIEPPHALGEFLGKTRPPADADIAAPLAQRRHLNRKHVQTVIQIFAKLAGARGALDVAVGRRHHAHVDLACLRAPHRLELAFLQDAQQLRL